MGGFKARSAGRTFVLILAVAVMGCGVWGCKKKSEKTASRSTSTKTKKAAGSASKNYVPSAAKGEAKAAEKDAQSRKGGLVDVHQQHFGNTPEGEAVDLFVLSNSRMFRAAVITYGATLVSLEIPRKNQPMWDVVLGYETLEGYLNDTSYFGCTVGRYANRIAKGTFELEGETYELATNNGPNHLHGGAVGFNRKVWDGEIISFEDNLAVKFTYTSPDGEEGYPGTLKTSVIYAIHPNESVLRILYEAETDAPTLCNLTHHSYFNLAGQGETDVLQHEIMIDADAYTPVDDTLIPTGEIASVEGTPFDFREPRPIGERIDEVDGGGYDHNYVLNEGDGEEPALAARVVEPSSGLCMEMRTTEPGLQFYTGNFLDGSVQGKMGKVYHKHYGFCLEAQHFPDAPNQPEFPSTVLRPGETYTQETCYSFHWK